MKLFLQFSASGFSCDQKSRRTKNLISVTFSMSVCKVFSSTINGNTPEIN